MVDIIKNLINKNKINIIMKESNVNENLNEIIISTSLNEENFFDFLKEVNNDYEIKKLINKSNISKIYQAKNNKEKRNVILKIVEKKKLKNNYDLFIKQLKREEEILNSLKKIINDKLDNIINLYKKFEQRIISYSNSNIAE